MKYRYQLIGLLLALPFVPLSALAEEFTITVPIDVRNLPPNVNGMLLACWVYSRTGNIGIGRLRVNISGGNYRGDAVIPFNVSPGQDPATVTSYECAGSFVGEEGGGTVHYFSSSSGPTFPLASGAPFKLNTGRKPIP